jgi:hypothetical protein
MKILVTLPFLFLIALGACKKPVLEITDTTIPPLVLSTPLQDSLPASAIKKLQLADVVGTKIKYHDGAYCSYFEYSADPDLLFEILSTLPFSVQGKVADTQCHAISTSQIAALQKNISAVELENTAFFWTADPSNVEVFECLKPPFRHTVQFVKNSRRILHRIEFLGFV